MARICWCMLVLLLLLLNASCTTSYVILNNCLKGLPVEITDVDVPTTIHLKKFNGNLKYSIKAVAKQPLPRDLKIKMDLRREFLGLFWVKVSLCTQGIGSCEYDVRNSTSTNDKITTGDKLDGSYEINDVIPLKKGFDQLGLGNELMMGNYLIRIELKQKIHERTLACFDAKVQIKE